MNELSDMSPHSVMRNSAPRTTGLKDFDIWTAISIFWRWKWLIIAMTLLGTFASIIIVSKIEPLYKASVTIEFQKYDTSIFDDNRLNRSTYADAEYLATQYALLKSRSLAERVVSQLKLDQNAYDVQSNTHIAPVRRSRIARIDYTGHDPAEATYIANALADNFIDSHIEKKSDASSKARSVITTRLASAKTALEEAERSFVDYAKAKGILELDSRSHMTSLEADSAVTLNNALAKAHNDRIKAEHDLLEIKSNQDLGIYSASKTLEQLNAHRAELSGDYQELRSTFQPQYPKMIQINNRIKDLDSAIKAEQNRLSEAHQSKALAKFNTAKATERSLQQRVDQLKSELQDLRDRRVEYNILEREVETARTHYDALLHQLKRQTSLSDVASSQISIIDRAIIPEHPYFPNKRNIILISAGLSLLLGFALAWILTARHDNLHNKRTS